MDSFSFLKHSQHRVQAALQKILPPESLAPQRLHQAMRYSVLAPGKRLRPALVYATGELFAADPTQLDHCAAAVELIHIFSLIHDDLPAMDDDTLRHGQPTCHIAFDEATAILTGDALQSLAFECLSDTDISLVTILAAAIGSKGMTGGQMIDIDSIDKTLDITTLTQMHRYKTGALITAAIQMGACVNSIATKIENEHLEHYAEKLGLAFQVQDDILDVTASTASLGKTSGKDEKNKKPTFVQLMGLEKSQNYAHLLSTEAITALEIFDRKADHLRALAKFSVQRDH